MTIAVKHNTNSRRVIFDRVSKSIAENNAFTANAVKSSVISDIQYAIVKSSKNQIVVNSKIGSGTGEDGLDITRFRYNQAPVETPNSVLVEFTLPNSESYVSGLIEVFANGNNKTKDVEWQEKSGDATKIQFIGSLSTTPLDSDEQITMNYITP